MMPRLSRIEFILSTEEDLKEREKLRFPGEEGNLLEEEYPFDMQTSGLRKRGRKAHQVNSADATSFLNKVVGIHRLSKFCLRK
jgi:hypothetical protein